MANRDRHAELRRDGVGSVVGSGGVHSGPSPENWCYNNLRWMDGAKDVLAEKGHLTNGTQVTITQILPYMPAHVHEVRCAKNGRYVIGPIGEEPRCTVHGSQSEMEGNWQKHMQTRQ